MAIEWWSQLKAHRLNRGYTQEQVADFMGWHRSKVGRIETGQTAPTVAELAALLELYGVEWKKAFEEDDELQLYEATRHKRDDAIRRLNTTVQLMTAEQVRALLVVANILTGREPHSARVRAPRMTL